MITFFSIIGISMQKLTTRIKRVDEDERRKFLVLEHTRHHSDKHHSVHRNRYNRNQDHRKMFHPFDGMDVDDADFENANKNRRMDDV